MVIGIDANEGIENRTDEMLELINANKLIDLHAREDPMSEIETYIRGRQRIDYTFATERAECVTYTNIAPYNEGIVSDHRALVVDIDIRRIQQGDLLRWERIERILRPGIKKQRQQMVTRMYEISKERRWEERIGEIKRSETKKSEEDKLDKLDKEITGVMLKQEKEVAKKSKPKSTKATNKAMLKHLLWKIALSGIKHKRDFTKRLNQIARKLQTQENDPAWEDLKKTSRELRKARKEKREVWRKVREEIRERNAKKLIENLPANTDPDKAKNRKKL